MDGAGAIANNGRGFLKGQLWGSLGALAKRPPVVVKLFVG